MGNFTTSSNKSDDFFDSAPNIVIDKILEKLPIRNAAQTSVLSKKWRRAWISLKDLVFDSEFLRTIRNNDQSYDLQKCSRTIGDILLHHNGPVHYFYLLFPFGESEYRINHSQWIAFLSKNGVRKIVMASCFCQVDITSYIFSCSELVHLHLHKLKLNPPPADFSGFPNLKYLRLQDIVFVKQNFLCSLINNCRKLETLVLVGCRVIDNIVIDAPSLQSLTLRGDFESLAFRNICSLKRILIALWITVPKKVDIVRLASCRQLQSIDFGGHLCKFFAAGSIRRSSPVTFNHVHELCLRQLKLGDSGVFRDFLSVIKCCLNIKKLDISVTSGESVGNHILDYNYDHKLNCLREVNIEGITGSSAELKLVEFLFAISTVLETLSFKYGSLYPESKMEILMGLMKFPRVSPKASLVCLKK